MTFIKAQRYIRYGWFACIILVVFLTPQWNDNLLENSTIASKTIFFVKGILFVCLSAPALLIGSKQFIIKFTKIDIGLAALVIYILINRPSYSPRMIDLITLTVFFILLRFASFTTFLLLFYTIAFAGVSQGIYGLLQLYDFIPVDGQFKLIGSFFNLGAYSSFLAFSSCISLGLMLFSNDLLNTVFLNQNGDFQKKIIKSLHLIPILNIMVGIIVLPISQNRTAWITFIITALFLYSYKVKIKHISNKRRISVSAIVVVVLLLFFTASVFIKKDSSDGRILIWKVTTEIIKDNPINGIGYDKFQAEYLNYQAGYLAKKGSDNEKLLADNVYYVFNDLLQAAAELGIIGFSIIVLAIILCYRIKDNENPLVYIAKGISVAYIMTSLFYYPHYILALKIPLAISLALLSLAAESKFVFSLPVRNGPLQLIGVFLILFFFCDKVFVFIRNLEKSHEEWRLAQHAYQSENYTQSLNHFNRALPFLKNDGVFLSQLGKTYLLVDSLGKARFYLNESKKHLSNTIQEIALGDINKRKGDYKAAEINYQKALDMVPNRFYPEYLLLNLYIAGNERTKVCKKAQEITNKKVKVFSTATQQIIDSARSAYSKYNCTN